MICHSWQHAWLLSGNCTALQNTAAQSVGWSQHLIRVPIMRDEHQRGIPFGQLAAQHAASSGALPPQKPARTLCKGSHVVQQPGMRRSHCQPAAKYLSQPVHTIIPWTTLGYTTSMVAGCEVGRAHMGSS